MTPLYDFNLRRRVSFAEHLPDTHSDLFVSMLHSPTLTTSHAAIAISTNEIAPPEELIERVVLQVFIEALEVNFRNQNIMS